MTMLTRPPPHDSQAMESRCFTVHTSVLFDAREKAFQENVSITVNADRGCIEDVYWRNGAHADVRDGDIDLREKVVMPGFVDAHTHIFLHSYE